MARWATPASTESLARLARRSPNEHPLRLAVRVAGHCLGVDVLEVQEVLSRAAA